MKLGIFLPEASKRTGRNLYTVVLPFILFSPTHALIASLFTPSTQVCQEQREVNIRACFLVPSQWQFSFNNRVRAREKERERQR
jgi:hypothetical protein